MKFSKSPLKIFSVERDKKKIWRSRFSHLILEQIYFNVSNIPRSLWMSSSLICANTKSTGKGACNQATEKAVPFRPLKKSIIKPYCINFWILFLCHWICTSTFSVLLKSSFHHWCLLSISHTMTHCTQHSKDYFSIMTLVTKACNSETEFQALLAVTKRAFCSWMHSN